MATRPFIDLLKTDFLRHASRIIPRKRENSATTSPLRERITIAMKRDDARLEADYRRLLPVADFLDALNSTPPADDGMRFLAQPIGNAVNYYRLEYVREIPASPLKKAFERLLNKEALERPCRAFLIDLRTDWQVHHQYSYPHQNAPYPIFSLEEMHALYTRCNGPEDVVKHMTRWALAHNPAARLTQDGLPAEPASGSPSPKSGSPA